MDIRQLRYFAAVAERLSFSRAAEHLNISQSALSRQVGLLEQDFGVRLFDRIGRGIALTPSGREMLPRCQAALKEMESVALRAAELAGGSAGRLRVGATPQTLESVMSRFLPRFKTAFPEVEIILEEDGSARLSRELERGRLDLAVGGRLGNSVLRGRELFPLAVLAVVPAASPHFGKARLDIRELAGEDLLLLRRHFMTRRLFDGACQAVDIRPRVMVESASPHCLLAFVASGPGTAVVPSTMLLGEHERNAIPLFMDGRQLGFAMSVLWDPRRYMPPAAEAFVEALQASTREGYPGEEFDIGPVPATIPETV